MIPGKIKKKKRRRDRKTLYTSALMHRASVYNLLGDFKSEEIDYLRVINWCNEKGFKLNTVVPEALIYLAGSTFNSKGDYTVAKKMTERAMRLLKKQEHPDIYAQALNTLGLIYSDRGEYSLAIEYINRSIKINVNIQDRVWVLK